MSQKKRPDCSVLERLYVKDRVPRDEIARLFNVNPGTIAAWCSFYGLKIRQLAIPQNIAKLYLEDKLSKREIARIYSVSRSTVTHWLKLSHIPLRIPHSPVIPRDTLEELFLECKLSESMGLILSLSGAKS